MAALVLTDAHRKQLQELRDRAAAEPIDVVSVQHQVATEDGKRAYTQRMRALSLELPVGFLVFFSIETGHPPGTFRHMSMSTATPGMAPHPAAVWMVAEQLGFIGGLEHCKAWPEPLPDGGIAVNLVQPLAMQEAT